MRAPPLHRSIATTQFSHQRMGAAVLGRLHARLTRWLATLLALAVLFAPALQGAAVTLDPWDPAAQYGGDAHHAAAHGAQRLHADAKAAQGCPGALPCCLACSTLGVALPSAPASIRIPASSQGVNYPIAYTRHRAGLSTAPALPPPRRAA